MQDFRRKFDQRRATIGNKCGRELRAAALDHVKRPAIRIENARGTLDDQPVQIGRPDGLR